MRRGGGMSSSSSASSACTREPHVAAVVQRFHHEKLVCCFISRSPLSALPLSLFSVFYPAFLSGGRSVYHPRHLLRPPSSPSMAPPANRAEMLALAAARGIALCPLALEDYDELFVKLTGDNGCGVVKAFANDELAAFSTSDLAGVRTPTVTPHHTRTMSCAFPPHFSCGFETPALCRRRVARMTCRLFSKALVFMPAAATLRRYTRVCFTQVMQFNGVPPLPSHATVVSSPPRRTHATLL